MANVPPPPPEIENLPKWADDGQAKQEEKNWPDEEALRGQRNKNDLLWLKCYGVIVVLVAIFVTVLFVSSIGIWAFNYLMPEKWHWLSPEQLSKIQSILFSGGLGGIVTSIVQKHISK